MLSTIIIFKVRLLRIFCIDLISVRFTFAAIAQEITFCIYISVKLNAHYI